MYKVRGQLDPPDKNGWRFIQTEDTPNQFKVLLPQRTAEMYAEILKIEAFELSRKSVNWGRVLAVRHLKERMIRKCQRLSPPLPTRKLAHGEKFIFQSIVAPSDFRLREMEKWLLNERSKNRPLPVKQSVSSSACCARCTRSDLSVNNVPDDDDDDSSLPSTASSDMVASPPNSSSPPSTDPKDKPAVRAELSKPPLHRRRSCIKRRSSDQVKVVSWADDLRDLSHNETPAVDTVSQLDQLQLAYKEQMSQLELLRLQVDQTLEHLRSETTKFQEASEAINTQICKLQATFVDMEHKRSSLQKTTDESAAQTTEEKDVDAVSS